MNKAIEDLVGIVFTESFAEPQNGGRTAADCLGNNLLGNGAGRVDVLTNDVEKRLPQTPHVQIVTTESDKKLYFHLCGGCGVCDVTGCLCTHP